MVAKIPVCIFNKICNNNNINTEFNNNNINTEFNNNNNK